MKKKISILNSPSSTHDCSSMRGRQFSIQRGFTLIELITAIGVLAILSTVILSVINPMEQFNKAQDSKRKSDLAQIQRGLETYYQDCHRYPPAIQNQITSDCTGSIAVTWGSSWRPYMDVLPTDPASGKKYVYWVDESNGGQAYAVYSFLARASIDTQACNGTFGCEGANSKGLLCGGAGVICAYGVSSPNISP